MWGFFFFLISFMCKVWVLLDLTNSVLISFNSFCNCQIWIIFSNKTEIPPALLVRFVEKQKLDFQFC